MENYPDTKRCPDCQRTLCDDNFDHYKDSKLSAYCKDCLKIRRRVIKDRALDSLAKEIENQVKKCSRCDETKPVTAFYKSTSLLSGRASTCRDCDHKKGVEYRTSHADAIKKKSSRFRVKLRNEVLSAYGNICVCCGESTPEFLVVDHIQGGGARHVASVSNGNGSGTFYDWLRKNNFPKDGFRLLCDNCNASLGRYGYCPHQLAS